MATDHLHIAVARWTAPAGTPRRGASPSARPDELFTAGATGSTSCRTAERACSTSSTIEDAFGLQSARCSGPTTAPTRCAGRLDALLIASAIAPAHHAASGSCPTVTTTHTEPFHVATAIATLDHVSERPRRLAAAGVGPAAEAALSDVATCRDVRRADLPTVRRPAIADLFAEAADAVEVVRRLWDSWEDDAEIRDVATGRFIDRDKLHYVDFEGRFFSVRAPRSCRARRRASRWWPRSRTTPTRTSSPPRAPTSCS